MKSFEDYSAWDMWKFLGFPSRERIRKTYFSFPCRAGQYTRAQRKEWLRCELGREFWDKVEDWDPRDYDLAWKERA